MTVIPPEEQTPLLAPENAPSPSSHKNTKPLRFTVLCIIFLLTVEFGSFVMVPPGTEILESIICRQYYDAHDPNRFPGRGKIPERDCKVDKVAGEVALIQGVLMSLYMVPSEYHSPNVFSGESLILVLLSRRSSCHPLRPNCG